MIRFLLAALIILNVSLAQQQAHVEDEKEASEGASGEQRGPRIEKTEPTAEQQEILRQYMERDKQEIAHREELRDKYELPYADWKDEARWYIRHKDHIIRSRGWTFDELKFWDQQAPNVKKMSGHKYIQYVVNERDGSFMGHNQTWILLLGTHVDNATQDVAKQMNILAKKFKNAKKTTYRWEFIDIVVDENLASSLGTRKYPMVFVVDGHDEMVYTWDKPELPNNKTLGAWLRDRDYKDSALKFRPPNVIRNKMQHARIKIMKWARKHIAWGFENILRKKPQFIKNIFAPVMNHDGNDPLRLKGDRLIWLSAGLLCVFVILPIVYLILRFLRWLCAYRVIIEVDDAEWEELKKKGKVE